MIRHHVITASLIPALFLAAFVMLVPEVRGSLLQNTIGWIWGGMDATGGGNTSLGWISLNSRDCDSNGDGTVGAAELAVRPACPSGAIVDYGVNIPESGDGGVSGYAWTEHYGWISFNASDVSGCPSGSCDPRRASNRHAGWARILSIRDLGANAGGWSGFIKLSSDGSDSVSYGVAINGKFLSGYAYSDELGWIDFATAEIASPSILHVCENSCSSTFLRGKHGGASTFPPMSTNSSRDLVACYNSSGNCTDASGDVTSATTWTETDAPNNAITLSVVSSKERVTAGSVPNLEESFSASYSGQTATMTVNTSCVPTVFCATDLEAAEQVCENEMYTLPDNGCGEILVCEGTRVCADNWTEVAP